MNYFKIYTKSFLIVTLLLISFVVNAGQWEFGPDIRSWDYREYAKGAELMRDYGILKGIALSYQTEWTKDLQFSWEWSYVGSNTKYDGQLQDGTPYESDSRNFINTIEFRFLRTYRLYALFLGFAWQKLNNPELADEPADYSRTISYLYFPLGYKLQWKVGSTYWETMWSYYLFMSGTVNTMLSEVGYSNDVETAQNKGKGYSIMIAMHMSNWKFELYTRYWNIDASSIGSATDPGGTIKYFYEPENTTHSYGLKIKLLF